MSLDGLLIAPVAKDGLMSLSRVPGMSACLLQIQPYSRSNARLRGRLNSLMRSADILRWLNSFDELGLLILVVS
jgi:hypothetical protein